MMLKIKVSNQINKKKKMKEGMMALPIISLINLLRVSSQVLVLLLLHMKMN